MGDIITIRRERNLNPDAIQACKPKKSDRYRT